MSAANEDNPNCGPTSLPLGSGRPVRNPAGRLLRQARGTAGCDRREPSELGRVIADPLKHREVHGSYDSDILAEGLDVIFCGINPASSAVAAGHNFSNGNNRFWAVLHLAGFADVRLRPQDERRLLEYGCGISAVVRRATRMAAEVSPEEFREARPEFEAKMRRYAPRAIAFLGKRAVAAMTGRPDVHWGRFPEEFAGTMAWILPNPSGLNRGFTLDALVVAYRELRIALTELRGDEP